jgi:hypothetical protein
MYLKAAGALILLMAGVADAQVGLNVDVEQAVRAKFADAPVMIEIARCESKFRQYTDAGNPLYGGHGGKMVGVFQIYSDVHAAFAKSLLMDIETLDGNLEYAKYLYDRDGTHPWNSSAACWRGAEAHAQASETIEGDSPALTMDLSTGMDHPQVRALQQFLNRAGFTIAESGPGSPGNETTMYGALTRAAVQRFQCAKSIVCGGDGFSTGYGVFGPRTRAALAAAKMAPVASAPESPSAPSPAPLDDAAEIARLEAQIEELKAQLATLLAARES